MLRGAIDGCQWRLERGKPTRTFIRGTELRIRAELGADDSVAILVMNRHLKNYLEKKAYQIYTDSLQTTADPDLPEEMRWLAMYPEVGWDGLPAAFWDRYCVLSDERVTAQSWLTPEIGARLLDWPALSPETSFMLMLLRGKAYLRMEFAPQTADALQHAMGVFDLACHSALDGGTTASSNLDLQL